MMGNFIGWSRFFFNQLGADDIEVATDAKAETIFQTFSICQMPRDIDFLVNG